MQMDINLIEFGKLPIGSRFTFRGGPLNRTFYICIKETNKHFRNAYCLQHNDPYYDKTYSLSFSKTNLVEPTDKLVWITV